MPHSGAEVTENSDDISAFSFNSGTHELVSFDTTNIVKLKAKYVQQKKLGGLMYWDVSSISGALCIRTLIDDAFMKLSQDKTGSESPTLL